MSDIVRGTTVLAGPLETTFEITGDMVGGAYCVVRQTVKAGSLFWPHIHVNEDQVIVVLSGELGVRVGDEEWTASAGETVYRPKGLPHAVWNSGAVDVEMLEITSQGTSTNTSPAWPKSPPPETHRHAQRYSSDSR